MTIDITVQGKADSTLLSMKEILDLQKHDFHGEGKVTAEVRIDRLQRGIKTILKYQEELVQALSEDFGFRSREMSLLTEVAASITPMKTAIKHLRKWMRAEKRNTIFPMNIMGGRSRIEYQPLGVVGVISPWNFPVNLTFGPMADILAAGNRVMIKPSEYTPAVSQVISKIVSEAWKPQEVAIFTGGAEVSQAFSALPFDHLLFTGSTQVGRHVMAAAAKNLVPVTLELGGKSPVVIGRNTNIKQAMQRIMAGKTLNAGQICIAPDYLMVPGELLPQVIEEAANAVRSMFPKSLVDGGYTSIINKLHFNRLQAYLEDALDKGASVVPVVEEQQYAKGRIMPPTIITDVTDDMQVMQNEIFGPLLPVTTYDSVEEVVTYINARPRPLALYLFGCDEHEERYLLDHTTSGGVCINDVAMHYLQEDLPFGGVGASGMGAYHGRDGFKTFSHAKSIFKQTAIDFAGLAGMRAPFGKRTLRTVKFKIGQ